MIRVSPILLMLTAASPGCADSGESDPCANVVCEHPPGNQCKDASTLLVYPQEGTCDPDTGTCQYPAEERNCSEGCVDGRCTGSITLSGWIMVLELNDGYLNPGWGSGVSAFFSEQPHFVWYPEHRLDLQCQEILTEGGCTLFSNCQDFDRMCDPVCAMDEQCVYDGVTGECRKFAVSRNVGVLSLDGLKASLDVMADEFDRYFASDAPADLFDQGDVVTVRTSGGETDPFSLQATGVAPIAVESSDVELATGQASEVSWTPEGSQARVQVVLSSGWHYPYAPQVAIRCDVPDSDGQVIVPAAIVDGFLERGSLFNRPSHALRYTRTLLPMQDGEVELTVGSAANLRLFPR